MELNEYQRLASRTANTEIETRDEILDYALGLAGESGEFVELIKKWIFHGHNIGSMEFDKELGDVLWYVSQLARILGASMDGIAQKNIAKLEKRYPEKFNSADSIARVDTKEQG